MLATDTVRNLHVDPTTNTGISLVPTSTYTYQELTDAYNQTRVDYIVPMPMNSAKLQEYVETYDVDMDASAVVLDADGQKLSLGMLGVREHRAWITRLGVIRANRRQRVGWRLASHLIEQAYQKNADYVILEVIDDNFPAYNLFIKKGFKPVRELLVLRRPPSNVEIDPPDANIDTLSYSDAVELLKKRSSKPSWLDEYESLLNAGNLSAFYARLSDGSEGWLVYQNTVFQLGRLVIQTEAGNQVNVGRALLHHLHTEHPVQDTKTENLPANDPHWPAFEDLGYMVSFRRVEMILPLK
jgi:ribosomal protein S18 acetylase RimI-like enzyme